MIRVAGCILITMMCAITTTDVSAQAPQAGPDHARLSAMVGVWDVEVTFWLRPGGPGMASKGVSTIQPLFGGLFIEEKIEGTLNGVPFTDTDPSVTCTQDCEHQHDPYRRDRRLRRKHQAVRAQGGVSARRRNVASTHGHSVHVGRHHDGHQLLELRHGARMEGRRDQVHAADQVAAMSMPKRVAGAAAYTNPPHIIMQNDRVVSINNTRQIDLQGQAASESDGHRHLSGTGGQPQFVCGATDRRVANRSSACRPPMRREVSAAAASCLPLRLGTL